MLRHALRIAVIFAVGSLIAWLADNPGAVMIDWQGWRIETSFAVLGGLVAALVMIVVLLQSMWSWARKDLPFVGANRHLRRQRRGLDALNNAVIALSAGRGQEARRLADKAQRLLPPQPMTHVIAAQAAQLNGDSARVRQEYEALRQTDESAFIGVRGLLNQAVMEGRGHEAMRLAAEAVDKEPDSPWALQLLYELLVARGKWARAQAVLDRMARQHAMEPTDIKRHRATLLYALAQEADLAGDTKAAQKALGECLRLAPDLQAASLLSARLALRAGDAGRATKVMQAAWSKQPSAEILSLYEDIQPTETATERRRRIIKLTAKNKMHPRSQLALARYGVKAGDFAEARKILDSLLESGSGAFKQAQVLAQAHEHMAELELAQGKQKGGQALAKAEEAAREHTIKARDIRTRDDFRQAAFQCIECGAAHDAWHVICPSCQAFASVGVRDATQGTASKPSSAKSQTPLVVLGADAGQPTPGSG